MVPQHSNPVLEYKLVSLQVDQEVIYEQFYDSIQEVKYEPKVREKLLKQGFDPSHYNKIDWNSMESCLPKCEGIHKYTKTIWELWHTNNISHRQNYRTS